MANIPSEQEIKQIQDQNDQEIADKLESQIAQGKSFNISPDGHGPGVVPEPVWQNLPGKTEQSNG